MIQKSQEFVEFVDISTKLVERALNEKYDFMKDYTLGIDTENDETSGKHVKFVCKFWDEKWCKNRSVTDVNWSLKVSRYDFCLLKKAQVLKKKRL
jgi:dynein intermediate chain